MKLNITIKSEKWNTEIVNIDIKNGNWKYIDDTMETDEKISLTMNNVREAYYLSMPVKDEYPHYDWDLYKETGEVKQIGATVRTYDNLHEFLICRINNTKEDATRKYRYEEKIINHYKCALLDKKFVKTADVTMDSEIVFEKKDDLTVTIEVIE